MKRSFFHTSKTWIILSVFIADAVVQLIRDGYHLDPVLAALVAAALGIRAYKDTQGTVSPVQGSIVPSQEVQGDLSA